MISKETKLLLLPGAALILALLLPSPLRAAPAYERGASPREDGPRWGLVARYGYYGLPDWLLDLLFEEHPAVDGTIGGGEVRYYGDGGPSGTFSIGLAVDVGSSEGSGVWQESSSDVPVAGGGEVSIVAATLTAYWDLWSSRPLHPYFGLGVGAGYAEGTYDREGEAITVDEYVPVLHLPVGIVLNLGDHLGASLEGRIIDGISWGGSLQVRF